MRSKRGEADFESRRQRIIDGALRVFAEKGFEEATNREIAKAAGINSPGLIYHYFKGKEDLFRQVIEQRVPLMYLISHPSELAGKPPKEVLNLIGRTYLRILDDPDAVSAFRLIIGEAARRPHVAEIFNEIGPSRVFRFLGEYIQSQIDAGVFRQCDPGFAARFFFSPFVTLVLTREVLRQPEARSIEPAAYVEANVAYFLRAMSLSE